MRIRELEQTVESHASQLSLLWGLALAKIGVIAFIMYASYMIGDIYKNIVIPDVIEFAKAIDDNFAAIENKLWLSCFR